MRRLLIGLAIIGLELIFAGQVLANAKIHESPVEYSSQGVVLRDLRRDLGRFGEI